MTVNSTQNTRKIQTTTEDRYLWEIKHLNRYTITIRTEGCEILF